VRSTPPLGLGAGAAPLVWSPPMLARASSPAGKHRFAVARGGRRVGLLPLNSDRPLGARAPWAALERAGVAAHSWARFSRGASRHSKPSASDGALLAAPWGSLAGSSSAWPWACLSKDLRRLSVCWAWNGLARSESAETRTLAGGPLRGIRFLGWKKMTKPLLPSVWRGTFQVVEKPHRFRVGWPWRHTMLAEGGRGRVRFFEIGCWILAAGLRGAGASASLVGVQSVAVCFAVHV